MSESGFTQGSRVRLKATEADLWVDAKVRARAKSGRVATVLRVIGTALPFSKRSYLIEFDRVGREMPFISEFYAADLEAAP